MSRHAAVLAALLLPLRAASQSDAPPSGEGGTGAATATPADSNDKGAKESSSAATAKAPPAAARQISRALLPQEKWDHLLDSYAASLTRQLQGMAASSGGSAPQDLEDQLRAQLRDEMKYQDTVDIQAQAIARKLSGAELQQAARFYQSPAGKKLVDGLPDVQSEVSEQLQQKLASAVPRIVKRVAPDAMPKSGAPPSEPSPPAQGRTPPVDGSRRP